MELADSFAVATKRDSKLLLTEIVGKPPTVLMILKIFEHTVSQRASYGFGFFSTSFNILKALEGLLWRIYLDPLPAGRLYSIDRVQAKDKVKEQVHMEWWVRRLTLIP